MNNRLKFSFFLLMFLGILNFVLFYFYYDGIAVLNPKGLIAEKQRDLLLFSLLVMQIVVLPAILLSLLVAWRYRESNKKATYSPNWDHSSIAEVFWWGIPLIITVVLGVVTWKGCHELDQFKPLDSKTKPVRIQVVALNWKWLFIYPDYDIAMVNYTQFPMQTPINFEITSDATMNSFWIPQLGGQIYAMAGMRTKLHLIANGEGSYRGSSANLSGEGFAGMTFTALSCSNEDFDAWVDSVKESGLPLGMEEYKELAAPSKYNKPSFYVLKEKNLFDTIIMSYMNVK